MNAFLYTRLTRNDHIIYIYLQILHKWHEVCFALDKSVSQMLKCRPNVKCKCFFYQSECLFTVTFDRCYGVSLNKNINILKETVIVIHIKTWSDSDSVWEYEGQVLNDLINFNTSESSWGDGSEEMLQYPTAGISQEKPRFIFSPIRTQTLFFIIRRFIITSCNTVVKCCQKNTKAVRGPKAACWIPQPHVLFLYLSPVIYPLRNENSPGRFEPKLEQTKAAHIGCQSGLFGSPSRWS